MLWIIAIQSLRYPHKAYRVKGTIGRVRFSISSLYYAFTSCEGVKIKTSSQLSIEALWRASCPAASCSCHPSDQKALQRAVRTAEKSSRTSTQTLQDLCQTRCLSRATKIINDSAHPTHGLFNLLPSGKRYRSTARLTKSFFPQTIRLLNSFL